MLQTKFYPTLFLLLALCQTACFTQAYKQDAATINELNAQLLRYKKAFLEDDVETAIVMTHPEMATKMGGPVAMRAAFQKGKEIRAQKHMQYTGLDFTLPESVLATQNSIQAAFPMTVHIKFEDGSMQTDHRIMVAVKDLATSGWYFLSVPPEGVEKLRASLSFIDPQLVFPK